MPPVKRFLQRVMWFSGGLAVLAVLTCIVLSNFFFPAADLPAPGPPAPQVSDSTFFHPEDTGAIRAWKISLTVFGGAVGLAFLAALIHGFVFPPVESEKSATKGKTT